MGHTVKLIRPQFVKPYVTGTKNDSRDAAALCEAVSRPHRRFVPLKTGESHEIHAIHRLRSRLMKERTALVNQVRGLLAERGMVIARGMTRLRHQRPTIGEEGANKLTPMSREVRRGLYEELVALAERIARTGHFVQRLFAEHTQCRAYAVPEARPQRRHRAGDRHRGRHLAAWLGLVPRHYSRGGKERLRGISNRGDQYLRTLLSHGARATAHRARRKTDARSRWSMSLEQRRGKHSATVAIANTKARLARALLTSAAEYRKAA